MPESFTPAWWCRNRHLQTVWPTLFRRHRLIDTIPERIELPDGDFVELAWPAPDSSSGPVVLVLHGLEGSVRSPYAQGMLLALKQSGYRGVLMHFRGCHGGPNRLPRSYHSGDTGDIDHVVRVLTQRAAPDPVYVIGYSIGGNALLKWLGECGADCPATGAVAVSVPFDLADCADRMEQGVSRIYQHHFIRRLHQKIRHKHAIVPLPIDMTHLKHWRSFWQFDHEVTAPLNGFTSAAHYYRESSSRQFLRHIDVPTLIIHARDDPFMLPRNVPGEQEIADRVTLEVSGRGGHVGFIAGRWPWRPVYWLEPRILAWLDRQRRATQYP